MVLTNNKILLVAEIANSHEGNFDAAKKLIDAVSYSRSDAVKFQIFKTAELLEHSHENFSSFQKLEFTEKQWSILIKYAKFKKLKVFADVFGITSAKIAHRLKVDGYKIHTSDITNPLLLNFFTKQKTTILLSTGGVTVNEILNALEKLNPKSNKIFLMHGFQGYPTKISDLNLSRISTLKKEFRLPVGIMDHVSGESNMSFIIPLLGISLGATIVEKHITLDRSLKGIDYFSSLNPEEFKKLQLLIKSTKSSLGNEKIVFSKNELEYRLKHKKNTLAKNRIQKHQKLNPNLFTYKRTRKKIESVPYFEFENNFAGRNIKKGEILTKNKLSVIPKVVAVIACRVESGRLFGKPLQNIENFSILHFLIKQIKTSSKISEIVLAISENQGNEIFIDFARKHRLKFVIGDDRDVLKRLIDGAKLVKANIVFRVTSENPFIFWEGIDKLIQNHIERNIDFSFVDNVPIGSGYEVINLKALEKSHKLGNKKHRSELCSLYIYEHQKDFSILPYQPPKEIQKPHMRLTVDTPEDLVVARIIHRKLGKSDKPIMLKKIVTFLETHPEVLEINSHIPIGVTRIWN